MAITGIEQPAFIQVDDGLRLRKYDGEHGFAFEWYQDEETVWLVDGTRTPYSHETLNAMYSYLNAHGELYFIEIEENGAYRPIGDVTFWQDDMPIVIGDRSLQGKKIGQRVIAALVNRGRELGYKELRVNEIYHYNTASRKCFEKAGFRVCGETEKGVSLKMEL